MRRTLSSTISPRFLSVPVMGVARHAASAPRLSPPCHVGCKRYKTDSKHFNEDLLLPAWVNMSTCQIVRQGGAPPPALSRRLSHCPADLARPAGHRTAQSTRSPQDLWPLTPPAAPVPVQQPASVLRLAALFRKNASYPALSLCAVQPPSKCSLGGRKHSQGLLWLVLQQGA